MIRAGGRMLAMPALLRGVLGVVAAALCVSGCTDESAGGTQDVRGQEFTVAFDVDGAPFSYVEDDEPAGFDVDIMDEIARREGFTLTKTSLPFDGIIPALQANQAQIAAAAISITEDRERVVAFSEPYYQTGLILATAPGASGIERPRDLADKSVAVRTGSSSSLYVESLPQVDDIEVHRYNNTNDQLQAVMSGVDDVAVNDKSIIDYFIAKRGEGALTLVGDLLTTDNYGYAVAKNQPALAAAIDRALDEMVADGTYASIHKRYFGTKPDMVPGEIG